MSILHVSNDYFFLGHYIVIFLYLGQVTKPKQITVLAEKVVKFRISERRMKKI